ncbi:MAG: prolipoprotein diacylglyceryl transferase [Verrucomicrobia bacterium]|nr:MAG: prolipoprotein diacylglyceryl transferase [Verrucomicrobiota bacterium]
MFATYVHDLNPVIVWVWRGLALRWYGLAYLAGFVVGFLLLRHLARHKLWVLAPEKTADFIAAAALFGVFLGGRIGYILFYFLPKEGIGALAADPLLVFRVWEGGMASHGGILGLVIFTWICSRREKVSWTGLGDGLCVVAPVGLFFGRIANFINGELYGRLATGVTWAVKFPMALNDDKAPEFSRFDEAAAAVVAVKPGLNSLYESLEAGRQTMEAGLGANPYLAARGTLFEQLLAANRHSTEVSAVLGRFLEPRHPSQLYEGLLEGLALFAILWWVRVRNPNAPNGLLTGLFFGFYALFRIFSEYFREPDAALVGPLTKGQFLSLFMLLFAAGFLIYAWKQHGKRAIAGPQRRR